jgi:hypothetical protein
MKTLPAGTVKRIHVDRRIIAQNRKNGTKLPHWTIQTSKGPIKCSEWKLLGPIQGSGPDDKQLSCGARVYMVTRSEVEYR